MESEKVITSEQTDIKGVVGQSEVKGGDDPKTAVAAETAKEEKVVPLKALLAEQDKKKSLMSDKEILERENNLLKAELTRMNQTQQTRKDPLDERDDYDPLTVGEYKQREAQIKAEIAHNMKLRFINDSAQRAREKYKESDFTYDDALKIFQSSALTDAERNALLDSTNPGERIMKYTKSIYQDENPVDSTKTQELADKITQNVNQTPTLSAATKTQSKSFNKLKELQKMTPAEIGRQLEDRVKQMQRGG